MVTGKTDEEYLRKGVSEYIERIRRYLTFEYIEIPSLKNYSSLSPQQAMKKEAEVFQKYISGGEILILLDEHGKQMRSVEFARFLEQRMLSGIKSLVFLAGGPFGFHPDMKKQANDLIALSEMTFSHQMVRLIFTEQLYRALTILRNESYHHE